MYFKSYSKFLTKYKQPKPRLKVSKGTCVHLGDVHMYILTSNWDENKFKEKKIVIGQFTIHEFLKPRVIASFWHHVG